MKFCPACKPYFDGDRSQDHLISCDDCGRYKITMEAYDDYLSKPDWHKKHAHKIIYYLNKFSSFGSIKSVEIPVLDPKKIIQISQEIAPSIAQQYENLILYIGNELMKGINANGSNTLVFIEQFELPYTLYAIGTNNKTQFNSIVEKLKYDGILEGAHGIKFSFDGWRVYDELKNSSKHKGYDAFMAMKFNDPELDEVYKKFFKPAVSQTNFNLKRIDEYPEAGIIDLRLRNKIRNCRFLIADLTHENNGAYWEAGYAEGLGKPVIYTCRKDLKSKTHFDTNHSLTVFWDAENIAQAIEELKSVIRYTIPESRQED